MSLQPTPQPNPQPFARALADEAATRRLAQRIAGLTRPGDVIALWGDLGTGKTAFARAFIQALDGEHEVPSPTFTLVQTYDFAGLSVWHFDLFRLSAPEEAVELGIEEAFSGAVSLIEWPDRLGHLLPDERLDIALAYGTDTDSRHAVITAHGQWRERLREAGFDDA